MSHPSFARASPDNAVDEEGVSLLHPFEVEDLAHSSPASTPSYWHRWFPITACIAVSVILGAAVLSTSLIRSQAATVLSTSPSLDQAPADRIPAASPPAVSPPPPSISPLQPSPSPTAAPTYTCPSFEGSVNDTVFFIVGDWGRGGSVTQTKVASMMAQVGACMAPDFILSTGDNFYEHGLSSDNDPQIRTSFLDVYGAPSLQVPWYAVLGNHDNGDGLQWEQLKECPQEEGPMPLDVKQRELCRAASQTNSNARSCCYSPLWQVQRNASSTANGLGLGPLWNLQQDAWQMSFGPNLAITFLDTSPFIRDYHKKHWAGLTGGIARSTAERLAQQKALVDRLLNSSTAPLQLVVGHHPIKSNGNKCRGKERDVQECEDMDKWLTPLLVKHKVLAYISGHEHDLQYIHSPDDPTHYIISGAGSDVDTDKVDKAKHIRGAIFRDQGFVVATVNEQQVTLFYYVSASTLPIFNVTFAPPT